MAIKFDKNFMSALKSLNSTSVRVGWGENLKYPSGESVAMVAQKNEFGNPSKNVPPRPFLRPTVEREKEKIFSLFKREAKKVLSGGESAKDAFDFVGHYLSGQVKWSVRNLHFASLAKKTVEARIHKAVSKGARVKKSVSLKIATPLVDTGYMVNSIMVEVSENA